MKAFRYFRLQKINHEVSLSETNKWIHEVYVPDLNLFINDMRSYIRNTPYPDNIIKDKVEFDIKNIDEYVLLSCCIQRTNELEIKLQKEILV